MPGSKLKRARRERTLGLLEREGTIDDLCAFIASGRTLGEFCAREDIRFNEFSAWIAIDDARRKRYEAAIELRDSRNKDIVVEQLRAMSMVDIAEAYDKATNCLLPIHDIPHETRSAIAGVKVREEYAKDMLSQLIASRFIREISEAIDLTDEQREALATWADIKLAKVKIGETVEVRMWDRNKSTETFARSLQQLTDKVEVRAKVTLEDLVAGSNQAEA